MFTQEPNLDESDLKPEEAFQKAIKAEVTSILDKKKAEGKIFEYTLFEGFGLDIAVFVRYSNSTLAIKFLELKAFVGYRPDGVGFGNGKGEGPQVDILSLGPQKSLCLNNCIRWILLDNTKKIGTQRYAIFDNITARKAAMGTVQKGKHNNFRVSYLMENSVDWTDLSKEINEFFSTL